MRFNKFLVCVGTIAASLLLWVGVAQAAYTSAQLVAGPDFAADGTVHYIAVFTGEGESDTKQDVTISAGGDVTASLRQALKEIAGKLNHTKAKDAALPGASMTFDVRSDVVTPPEDTAALDAFILTVQAWQVAVAKAAIGLATAEDVEAAVGQVRSDFNKASPERQVQFGLVILGYSRKL